MLAFEETQQALQRRECDTGAAEFHGQISARLCAAAQLDEETLLQAVCPVPQGDLLKEEAGEALRALIAETRDRLQARMSGFEPLLPGDAEASLEARTEALVEWCQGFLGGLAESGVQDIERLPGDVPEIVHDLVEIARAGTGEGGEVEEAAYAELVEYVRVGVQLVYEELQAGPDSTEPDTRH